MAGGAKNMRYADPVNAAFADIVVRVRALMDAPETTDHQMKQLGIQFVRSLPDLARTAMAIEQPELWAGLSDDQREFVSLTLAKRWSTEFLAGISEVRR